MPVTDLHRELSLITVQPNGGNAEIFRIHIPDDRVIGGGDGATTPPQLQWPGFDAIAGVGLEVFKVRNRNDIVVGLASRIAPGPNLVEWTVHLPARGTLYVPMNARPGADGEREGRLRAGTREFLDRSGSVRERFVLASGGDAGEGYIELQSRLIAAAAESGE